MKKLSILRRILCSFLAAAMMISAAGCKDKDNNSGNSAVSLSTPQKITNYFKATELQCPDGISDVGNIVCANNNIYMTGYMSADSAEHYLTVYDTKTGENVDIDISDINIAYYNNVLLTQDNIYLEYKEVVDNRDYISHICVINRSTGEKKSDKTLGSETYSTGMYENHDGNICLVETTYRGNTDQTSLVIYDKETLEEKERVNINEKLGLEDGMMIMLAIPQQDGSYYALAADMYGRGDEDQTIIYKFSSTFETIFKVDDVFNDMDGYLNGAYIRKNGNLCVMTYDYEAELYYINELDSLTGAVIERYEPELSKAEVLPFYTIGDYDFLFRRDGSLFGYDVENNEETEILDIVGKLGEEYENCYTMSAYGNSLAMAAEYYGGGGSEALYQLDMDGKILDRIPLPDGAQSYNMKVAKDGNMSFLCTDYSDGNPVYEICSIDSQGNEISRIPVTVDAEDNFNMYADDFIINSSGDICVAYELYGENNSKTIIAVYDKDGSEKFKIENEEINYVNGMFSCPSGDYIYYYREKGGAELSKIDYDNKCLGEKAGIEVSFDRIYSGDDKYDLYYNDGEGVYGYNLKDNKATEIINWIDSDIELDIYGVSLINSDKMIVSGYDRESGGQTVHMLNRVDDETLKLIQNKEIVTVAGVNISYFIRKDVVKFNKENDKYRIQMKDYGKYGSYEDDKYVSGAVRLNTDLASGSLPDILVGNDELDMSMYAAKGLLADLNPIIEKDPDVKKEDYFENIFDIYSTDGKLYQIVTDFNINTLIGKKSELGDKSGWTFDEFFEFADGKDVFYMTAREDLLNNFIKRNLSEYVDFTKKTCDFNNDNFIKLLEFIKEEGMTREELEEQSYYGKNGYDEKLYQEYENRFKNNKCYLEFEGILSTDLLNDLQQRTLEDSVSFRGIPSSSGGNGALITSDRTIGISEKSKVKDGAWDFVKGFILEDYQKTIVDEYSYTLPIMKSAFDDMLKKSQSQTNEYYDNLKPLDSETAENLKKIVENTSRAAVSDSRINKIIDEQVDIFFEGGQSAKEAAEAIQNKASLYLKEIK